MMRIVIAAYELKRCSNGWRAFDAHISSGSAIRIPPNLITHPITDIRHLSATINGAVNGWFSADFDSSIGYSSYIILFELIKFTTTTAIDVTRRIVIR